MAYDETITLRYRNIYTFICYTIGKTLMTPESLHQCQMFTKQIPFLCYVGILNKIGACLNMDTGLKFQRSPKLVSYLVSTNMFSNESDLHVCSKSYGSCSDFLGKLWSSFRNAHTNIVLLTTCPEMVAVRQSESTTALGWG